MAKTRFIDISDQTKGLIVLQDSTKAPFGSARVMDNCLISDRKGITKRPGISSLGDFSSGTTGNKSFFVYTKSFGSTEIAVKNYGTYVEYLHPDLELWSYMEGGFTTGQEFGYKEHLVNTENEDYMYMCNRTEDYRRWAGSYTQLNGALVGGETTVTVDTTLKPDVIYSGTASAAHSSTSLSVAGTPWASKQWVNFYVKITSGAESGKIRLITDTGSNFISFGALAGDPGACTFEIRMVAFAASGTLVIGTEEVAYSAIPTATTFTTSAIVSAHADNSAVTVKPTAYPANPRGNRLETHYTRMIVGNVRTALSRDSSGTLQGSQSTGSYYVSKLKNATDFTFTATRVAGEGDIVSAPYGGGDITDIVNQEDKFYVFKRDYIEAAAYSQDSNDIITREQLKPGFGSIGRTIRGKDDVYFITAANEITSLGRVEAKDSTPQSINIGYPIKRMLDTMDFVNTPGGHEFKDRLFFVGKESPDDNNYTRMIVFNRQTNSFEGVWQLSAAGMDVYGGELCYAESNTPNVFKMFQGVNDVRGTDIFGISMTYTSNWMNLTASNFNSQALEAVALEGYIRAGTVLTINLYKDFETTPFQTIEFSGDEEEFLSADNFSVFLGANPLGVEPMGSISDADAEGLRHFTWQFYFPPQYGNHFSYEYTNSGRDQYFDISRIGLGLSEDVDYDQNNIKTS